MILRAKCSHWWIIFYWRLEFMEADKKYIAVFGQRSSFCSNIDFLKFLISKNLDPKPHEKFRIASGSKCSEVDPTCFENWEL
jgi:hypothetical protein